MQNLLILVLLWKCLLNWEDQNSQISYCPIDLIGVHNKITYWALV